MTRDMLEAFVRNAWAGDAESLEFTPMEGGGSDRSFTRVRAGASTAVLVAGPDALENRAYAAIGDHLWRRGRWGPEILGTVPDHGLILIEDLGDRCLLDLVREGDPGGIAAAYQRTVALMADMHSRGLMGFDPDWCHQTKRYDRDLILERETGYFLSAFIEGHLGLHPDPKTLAGEFRDLAEAALAGAQDVLMHRDFQSKNVMIPEGQPRLIDFQAARIGPPGYDLASLIHDPYAALPPDLKDRLLAAYLIRRKGRGFSGTSFKASFPHLSVCRLLQALGAFGNLIRKGKPWFGTHVDPALTTLTSILQGPEFDAFPAIRRLAAEASGHRGH